mmetsp:Transcript_33818/g.53778  ORF Transcript_33818/g.53778 Transcript_33818/m.53778 type:complete len:201 (-) Transcript_33818:46-648(-)|eukprot:CAMPEP_0169233890 /NCGR_PEP_ID=MMETSP1016-20121227/27867_1 /TAXON_ID=342587 /ORGANISM="Karlodinium micrum, Strain CCMP2283" /LENGTH=200 /DNA_ID=CAMNT_0009313283 /DNA_START=66 /DNA_END=668 /DNA_ORIENTATION=-
MAGWGEVYETMLAQAGYGYGPAASTGSAAAVSPYSGAMLSDKKSDVMPEITFLEIPDNSPLVRQGYPPNAPAIEFWKEASVFSEAHHILADFFGGSANISASIQVINDPDGTSYPEVYAAWKAAGKEDNMPTIALCPSLGKWGVGLGGRKNAERAAKLALAVALATKVDTVKTATVATNFPSFRRVLEHCGLIQMPAFLP